MKYLRVIVSTSMLFVALSSAAAGRPLPLEPTFVTAGPSGYSLYGAAFEGDWMIASATATASPTQTIFLYRRTGLGPWTLQGKLAEVATDYPEYNTTGTSLAMENGLLVFEIKGKLYIYERTAAGYQRTAVLDGGFNSAAVRIDKARIIAGLGTCVGAVVIEKNAAGAWAISGTLRTTNATPCSSEFAFTDYLDVSGDFALVPTRGSGGTVQVFRYAAGQAQWPKTSDLTPNTSSVGTGVALRGVLALVGGNTHEGTRVFQRVVGSTTWNRTNTLRTVDLYVGSQGHVSYIRERGELWLLDKNLWRQATDNTFEHLATLNGDVWSEDVGGRTVLAAQADGIATYILPATFPASPATLRDDFQGNGSISWQLDYGYSYAQSGFTRVLHKQANQEAQAVVEGADWLNQSIQADVRPTAFNGSTGYVALTTRRSSDGRSFYQARFSPNSVRIIRLTQGPGYQEIARAGVPFVTNRTYRVRFETRGSLLRVFVDGAEVISIKETTLTHGGAGLGSENVVADFDNVIVSPLTTPLFSPLDLYDGTKWTARGGAWINGLSPPSRRQTDKTVLARSLTGVPETDDQIIETVARIDSLPPTGDRWVGVIARYRDDANHYYVSLGVNSGLQIRRVAGGAVTVLASIPYAVHGNVSYRLRFEAVGDQLRAYVNDVFLAEAHDASFGTGRFGVATNLAAATFSELNATQP